MKKNILVIDDEKYIVLIFKEVLSSEGYNVIAAYSGKDGLDKLFSSPTPDLVIVDLFMTCGDGKELIEEMRKHEQYNSIPVILCTGSDYQFHEFPNREDYQVLIKKPFDLDHMVKAVAELIG